MDNQDYWNGVERRRAETISKAQAAIALKVPRSGNPELDAMIRESRRLDMATAAMQAMIGNELDCTIEALAGRSRVVADALLAASEKEERKC